MKAVVLVAGLIASAAMPAYAADSDFSSPYDTNPRCTERNVDSSAPECITYTPGDPRQSYPPPQVKPPTTPGTTPPAASPPASKPQAPRPGASK